MGISCLGPVLYDGDCDDDDHSDVDDDEDDENSGCPGTVEGISYLGPVLILFLLHSTPHLSFIRDSMSFFHDDEDDEDDEDGEDGVDDKQYEDDKDDKDGDDDEIDDKTAP